VVSFTPRSLYPRERVPGSHWIGGWVGPRFGLNTAVVKRKIPSSRREANPRTPIVQPAAQRCTSFYIYKLNLSCYFEERDQGCSPMRRIFGPERKEVTGGLSQFQLRIRNSK